MANRVIRALSTSAPAKPPTEFRLFARGENETSKGTFVFDGAAAASVMAAYRKSGVELPIDLEHMSLDNPARSARTDASDARGWFKLAIRNGELWAIGVTWTPDGKRRLRDRTARYISPAFTTDDDGRVRELINCALVAMPATHNAQPLAASRYGAKSSAVVTTRLTNSQLRWLDEICRTRKCTRGRLLRDAVFALANRRDPEHILDDIKAALDLSDEAELEQIFEALRALAAELEPANDPTSEGPDEALSELLAQRRKLPLDVRLAALEPKPAKRAVQLTENERRLMKPMNPAQRARFLELRAQRNAHRASLVRRSK